MLAAFLASIRTAIVLHLRLGSDDESATPTEQLERLLLHMDVQDQGSTASAAQKLHQLGLVQASFGVAKRFGAAQNVELLRTTRGLWAVLQVEPEVWMVWIVAVPAPTRREERMPPGPDSKSVLRAMRQVWETYRLFHGSLAAALPPAALARAMEVNAARKELRRLRKQWERQRFDVQALDLDDPERPPAVERQEQLERDAEQLKAEVLRLASASPTVAVRTSLMSFFRHLAAADARPRVFHAASTLTGINPCAPDALSFLAADRFLRGLRDAFTPSGVTGVALLVDGKLLTTNIDATPFLSTVTAYLQARESMRLPRRAGRSVPGRGHFGVEVGSASPRAVDQAKRLFSPPTAARADAKGRRSDAGEGRHRAVEPPSPPVEGFVAVNGGLVLLAAGSPGSRDTGFLALSTRAAVSPQGRRVAGDTRLLYYGEALEAGGIWMPRVYMPEPVDGEETLAAQKRLLVYQCGQLACILVLDKRGLERSIARKEARIVAIGGPSCTGEGAFESSEPLLGLSALKAEKEDSQAEVKNVNEAPPSDDDRNAKEAPPSDDEGDATEAPPSDDDGDATEAPPGDNDGDATEAPPGDNDGDATEAPPGDNDGDATEASHSDDDGDASEATPRLSRTMSEGAAGLNDTDLDRTDLDLELLAEQFAEAEGAPLAVAKAAMEAARDGLHPQPTMRPRPDFLDDPEMRRKFYRVTLRYDRLRIRRRLQEEKEAEVQTDKLREEEERENKRMRERMAAEEATLQRKFEETPAPEVARSSLPPPAPSAPPALEALPVGRTPPEEPSSSTAAQPEPDDIFALDQDRAMAMCKRLQEHLTLHLPALWATLQARKVGFFAPTSSPQLQRDGSPGQRRAHQRLNGDFPKALPAWLRRSAKVWIADRAAGEVRRFGVDMDAAVELEQAVLTAMDDVHDQLERNRGEDLLVLEAEGSWVVGQKDGTKEVLVVLDRRVPTARLQTPGNALEAVEALLRCIR